MKCCFKKIYGIIFLFLFVIMAGCSKDVMDDIDAMIKSEFGGYTKEEPLTVYVLPFRPNSKFDVDSRIGKIAWDGAVDGVKDSAFFSDGKIKPKIFNNTEYVDQLRNSFWDDMSEGDKKVRSILRSTAQEHEVNSIVYGLYDGDDSELKLIISLYSDKDDIVLKEKTEMAANFMDLKSLRDAIKDRSDLTVKQKELRKMIHEKSKVATTHLLRKYMEGKNNS